MARVVAGIPAEIALAGTAPPSLRLVSQTFPFLSTVVREGLAPRPAGEVLYSPSTAPVRVSILTNVPLPDTAIQMKFNAFVVSSSAS